MFIFIKLVIIITFNLNYVNTINVNVVIMQIIQLNTKHSFLKQIQLNIIEKKTKHKTQN